MKRLEHELKCRFATIIEEDVETEGFWETVAEFYGVDQNDLTEKQRAYAERIAQNMANRVSR